MADEIDWVILRRYDDPIEAEIAVSFLREHDVTVALQGNSGSTSVLNRFTTVLDVRVVVPRDEIERATEVLEAMMAPEADDPQGPPIGDSADSIAAPYRGAITRTEPSSRPTRYGRAAFVLAFALPIGSGHLYARHHTAGAFLGTGIVGCFFIGLVTQAMWLCTASFFLIVLDAVFGVAAARRFNDGAVTAPNKQASLSMLAIALSVAAAFAMTGGERATSPQRAHALE